MLDGAFHGTEALDQLLGALVADARRAGNIIDGVALEREQVGHLLGSDAHEGFHFFGVVPLVILGGVEHGDALADELQHILIAGDDHHLAVIGFGAAGKGADYVVGLEAWVFDHGDAHGVQKAADVGDLLQQVGRRFRAVGLIVGEFHGAVGGLGAFVNCRHIGRLVLLGKLAQHIRKNEDRFGGKTRGSAHGRRGAAGPGVVGAKDKPEGIDEEKSGTGHVAIILDGHSPGVPRRAGMSQYKAKLPQSGHRKERNVLRNSHTATELTLYASNS